MVLVSLADLNRALLRSSSFRVKHAFTSIDVPITGSQVNTVTRNLVVYRTAFVTVI
jgi:hypothetical protein